MVWCSKTPSTTLLWKLSWLAKIKTAQQSVHLTLGILRQSQAVFYALSFFLAGRLRRPRPSAGNANRWGGRAKTKCKIVFDSQISFQVLAFCSTAFLLLAKFSFGFIESLKSASRFLGFGFGQLWFFFVIGFVGSQNRLVFLRQNFR